MKAVVLAPAARTELDAAADLYEREREALGFAFYAVVERGVQIIARFPEAGEPYPGLESSGVRRRLFAAFRSCSCTAIWAKRFASKRWRTTDVAPAIG